MRKIFIAVCLMVSINGVHSDYLSAGENNLTGKEVVSKCDYKNKENDQQSKLTIILKDKNGNEKKTVNRRMWKNYHKKNDIESKMVLFTEYPPDFKGTAFMRWGFTPESGKNDELFIYLPVLRKVRRVPARDINDKFMGSDLTYSDVSARNIEKDDHKLIKIESIKNEEYYVVESIPREKKPFYSKRVSWFRKTHDLSDCVKTKIDYYDKKGALLKKQNVEWQKIKNIWVWKKVVTENVQNSHSTIFEISDVKVNIGLSDNLFTERFLKRGMK